MSYLKYSSVLAVPRPKVFAFVSDLRQLPKLMPPQIRLEVKRAPPKLQLGSEYEYTLSRAGFSNLVWLIRINGFEQDVMISETQVIGLFNYWRNVYRFEDHGPGMTKLTSTVEYTMPFGLLGRLADDLIVRRDLEMMFKAAHENLARLLLSPSHEHADT